MQPEHIYAILKTFAEMRMQLESALAQLRADNERLAARVAALEAQQPINTEPPDG